LILSSRSTTVDTVTYIIVIDWEERERRRRARRNAAAHTDQRVSAV